MCVLAPYRVICVDFWLSPAGVCGGIIADMWVGVTTRIAIAAVLVSAAGCGSAPGATTSGATPQPSVSVGPGPADSPTSAPPAVPASAASATSTTPTSTPPTIATIFGHIVSAEFLPGYEEVHKPGETLIGPLTINIDGKGSYSVPRGLAIRKSCLELRSDFPEALPPCYVRLEVTADRVVQDLLVLWTKLEDPGDPTSTVVDVYMVGDVIGATTSNVTVSLGDDSWVFPLAAGVRYVCGKRSTPPDELATDPPRYSYLAVNIEDGLITKMECRV